MKILENDEPQICRLRIELTGSSPLIWRLVNVPLDFSLGQLHEVIQVVMPWDDYHLHEFMVGNKHYGEPDPEAGIDFLDEDDITLEQVFKGKINEIEYIYDFGDGWQHSITCESVFPAELDIEDYPICIDGAMACPPEDSGALFGYYRKLKILNNPDHDEHEDIKAWMPEDFDPQYFDIDETNVVLEIGLFPDEELDEIDQAIHETLCQTCAWCSEEFEDETPALSLFLKASSKADIEPLKGTFTTFPVGEDQRDIAAYVVPDDTQAKKQGKDIAILLCSEKCAEELHQALTYTFGPPVPPS
jgi:hypothetical protein